MSRFKTRVFGGGINDDVRKKLTTRQNINEGTVAINDTVSQEVLGLDTLTAGVIGSSQTPVVRMYTVIERVPKLSKEKQAELTAKATKDGIPNTQYLRFLVQQEERKNTTSKHVYMLGDYKGASIKINEPLTGQREDKDNFYISQQNNDFLKQDAGITSLSIKSEGSLGAILTSTMEFKVNNFHDFENIYAKHFLRPGSLVIIDAGWNTSELYDPLQLVNDNKLDNLVGPNSIIEHLHKDGGFVEQQNGDLIVTAGRVMDYSSKIAEDGTIDCSLTITSTNRGLIDQNLDAEDQTRAKFAAKINQLIDLTLLQSTGLDTINVNQILSGKAAEELERERDIIARAFSMNNQRLRGVNVMQGIAYDEDNKFYISIGLLEDEVLNASFSIANITEQNGINSTRVQETKFGGEGKFDSSESFIYINQEIKDYGLAALREKQNPIIIFPDKYDESYNKTNGKIPFIHENIKDRDKMDRQNLRIPIREVFIHVETVKKTFTTEKFRVSEAVQSLLDDINAEYSLYNLDIFSPTITNEQLSIVDRDLNDISNTKKSEFIFQPFSKTSQVLDVDLSYQMPKGGLQSMIAIQNSSTNTPIDLVSTQAQSAAHLKRLVVDNEETFFNRTLQSVNLDNKHVGFVDKLTDKATDKDQTLSRTIQLAKFANDPSIISKRLLDTLNTREPAQAAQLDQDAAGPGLPGSRREQEIQQYKKTVLKQSKQGSENVVSTGVDLARRRMLGKKETKAPLLPFSLNLTIFGTSGIFPGDLVSVDYLPKQIRDEATFVVTSVEHKFDQSWSTTLSTEMKLKDIASTTFVPITKAPDPKPLVKAEKIIEIPSVPAEKPPTKKPEPPKPKSNKDTIPGRPNPTKTFGLPAVFSLPALSVSSWEQGGDKSFGTFFDMMLDFKSQFYCSTDFVRKQAIKVYKNLVKNPGNYPSPVFSANQQVQKILEQNGYSRTKFDVFFQGKGARGNLQENKRYYKKEVGWQRALNGILNQDAMMIQLNPGERIYEYQAKPGLQPMAMWLKPQVTPPEPYLGYPGPAKDASENFLNSLGWNSAVFGQWQSDQNGYLLEQFPELRGPSEDRFSILRQLNQNDPDLLLIRFRQTPRGAFPDSFESNINKLITMFSEWKEIWFTAAVEEKVRAEEVKNLPKERISNNISYQVLR